MNKYNMTISYNEWLGEAKKENKFLKGISKSLFSKEGAATVGMGTYGGLLGSAVSAITGGNIPAGIATGALAGMGIYRLQQMGKGKRGRPVGSTAKAKAEKNPLDNLMVPISVSQLNKLQQNQEPKLLEPIKPIKGKNNGKTI